MSPVTKHQPIKLGAKLTRINTLTLFSALLILSVVILLTSFALGYKFELEAARSKSMMLSENLNASLVFNDADFAGDILASLNTSPEVSHAIVYDKNWQVLAFYSHNLTERKKPMLVTEEKLGVMGLSVVTDVNHNNQVIGHVYLYAHLDHLYIRLMWFLLVIIVSSIIALLLVRVLLNRLNQSILYPLFTLTEAALIVSKNEDFKVQVPESDIIELNILVDGFNQMLNAIRVRDDSLFSYKENLEEKVKQRTQELKLSTEESEQNAIALELKNDELKSAQSQLIQTAKLASVGEMATGIAHELNQPLGIISMNADLRLSEVKEGQFEKVLPSYKTILKQVQRATTIINHLRTFGRESSQDVYSKERIKTIIDDSFIMLNEQFKVHNIQISIDISDNLPALFCNRIQIEQVLTNLLVNAKDAMQSTDNKVLVVCVKQSGSNCVVQMSDSGAGIEECIIERIFDPFFTTKEVGKGTGLGLSISYGIIKAHSGQLSVQNNKNGGATFKIVLPFKKVNSSRDGVKKGL